jgi:soluble lytic murein transglycosylase-like protein
MRVPFMSRQFSSGVVLKETLVEIQRKWVSRFIFVNLLYIIVIVGLFIAIIDERKTISSFPETMQIVEDYHTKEKLYGILRAKGYSLGQGLDIVEAVLTNSKELELPLPLIMAVIHHESEFYPNAKSHMGAQGLMQIMPLKWDEYVAKLNLNVDRRAITDPLMNISVGCRILRDLYDRYSDISDDRTRMAKALTDYNNGENAKIPNLRYAVQVNRKQTEYEKKLR